MLNSDQETFDYIKQNLYVAAVCDILDELGYRNQAMHQRLRPLLPDAKHCGFVGRARARSAGWKPTILSKRTLWA